MDKVNWVWHESGLIYSCTLCILMKKCLVDNIKMSKYISGMHGKPYISTQNHQSWYQLDPIYFIHFYMGHPVVGRKESWICGCWPISFSKGNYSWFKVACRLLLFTGLFKRIINSGVFTCLLFSMFLTYEAISKINTSLIFRWLNSIFVKVRLWKSF